MRVGDTVKSLVLWAACGLIAACTSTTAPPPDTNTAPAFAEAYRIGIGDNLNVNVWRNPDLSIAVPVRPDGMITVPVVGDVMVGGETPEDVSTKIAAALSLYIRDPFVTVIVMGMGSADYSSRIRVTGAVNNPVSLPYRSGMTVMDVVLEAGGVNDFANPNRVTLYRSNGQRLDVYLDRILKRGEMDTNFALSPGDVISVPERAF